MTPIYYRDADAAILVFDLQSVDSFKRVEKWIEELKNYNKGAYMAILGNKADIKPYKVDIDDVKLFADSLNIKFFLSSALSGDGISTVFEFVYSQIAAKAAKKAERTKKLIVTKKEVKSSGCC